MSNRYCPDLTHTLKKEGEINILLQSFLKKSNSIYCVALLTKSIYCAILIA